MTETKLVLSGPAHSVWTKLKYLAHIKGNIKIEKL